MISFVRCSVRTIRTSNELAMPSLASRAEASAASTLAVSATEPLGRFRRGERVELGVAQRREHLPVGCERPSQATDSTASGAEQPDLLLRVVARIRECLHVELIERLFDLIEGVEIAGYDPFQNVSTETRAPSSRPISPFPSATFRKSSSAAMSALWAVSTQLEPRKQSTTIRSRVGVSLRVGDGDGRHPQMALVLLDPPVSSPDRRASTHRHRPSRAHRVPRLPAPGTHPCRSSQST